MEHASVFYFSYSNQLWLYQVHAYPLYFPYILINSKRAAEIKGKSFVVDNSKWTGSSCCARQRLAEDGACTSEERIIRILPGFNATYRLFWLGKMSNSSCYSTFCFVLLAQYTIFCPYILAWFKCYVTMLWKQAFSWGLFSFLDFLMSQSKNSLLSWYFRLFFFFLMAQNKRLWQKRKRKKRTTSCVVKDLSQGFGCGLKKASDFLLFPIILPSHPYCEVILPWGGDL